jgi:hypothetical protein
MKPLVAFSVAALFCLLALIQNAVAQTTYSCVGSFNICPALTCNPASGDCPDVPTISYVAFDESLNQLTTTCAGSAGPCSANQQVNACLFNYWTTRNIMGVCSNTCGTDYEVALCCQLP